VKVIKTSPGPRHDFHVNKAANLIFDQGSAHFICPCNSFSVRLKDPKTMKKVVWLAILFIIGMTVVETSKILVIPFGMFSHINLFTILGKALKDDGHDVWVLAFDKFEEEIKKRGLTPLTFPLKHEDDIFAKLDEMSTESPDGVGVIEKVFADPWWGMSFRKKFDLVVLDGADSITCFLMIPYKFDIPFVTVHGWQLTSWVYGVTGMPSIEPEFAKGFSNHMDFWQRLDNLQSWLERLDTPFYDQYSDHMNKYCPSNKPKIPLKKVAEMSEMYFLNFAVLCLDYPRVSAPNLQYIGGSTVLPGKPLPEDLDKYIAGAEHGVIVMSFGSMKEAHHLWKIIGEKLFDAFARLPQRVIVQYRLDKVYGKVPSNVKLLKWLPQNDLLANKNVKLFINHGGNNGQHEAAYHGVPVLVIPVYLAEYFDHIYNGRRIEVHSYGKYVHDKKAITSDQLYQMMTEIINNKTYAQNIKKCSEIIRSMPSAQEKFVFWVNHILRFGGAHLRPPSLDMPLYQVLMLDIVAYYVIYYLIIVHVVIFVFYFVIKYLWKRMNYKIKAE
jgi:glucuronosyltransferase